MRHVAKVEDGKKFIDKSRRNHALALTFGASASVSVEYSASNDNVGHVFTTQHVHQSVFPRSGSFTHCLHTIAAIHIPTMGRQAYLDKIAFVYTPLEQAARSNV